jgi:Rrf2 family iron-sulfur cluster assembly transcriptional regulator
MRLSTKAQYAVRAMVDLCLYSSGRPVSLRDISEREGIPLNYLEQLFFRLKKGNIVQSIRGPNGGYLLARDSARISLSEIITTVEEPLNPVACLDDGTAGCERSTHCATQQVWKGLANRIHEFLDSVSLEDLTRDATVMLQDRRLNSTP